MQTETTKDPMYVIPENFRPPAAADYLGLSESTLAKLRMRHNRDSGPAFFKLGRSVIYRRSDLDAWIEQNAVVS